MTTLKQVMAELEAAGTAQNRKVYARHGAAEPMFGVSYADLGRIAKPLAPRKLPAGHELALQLWDTDNHDARVLALRIAHLDEMTADQAQHWLAGVDNYVLAEALGGLLSQTPLARELSDRWRDDKREWPASVGWFIVACTAEQPDVWSAQELAGLVGQIEREIGERPNRVRHEMNGVLIAIGLRDAKLRKKVMTVDARIGPVEVDHGETGCKTPAITPYIERTLAHREQMAERRAAKAQAKSRAKA